MPAKTPTKTATFIEKLVNVLNTSLNDQTVAKVISWIPNGNGFIIYDNTDFERTILPGWYKHAAQPGEDTQKVPMFNSFVKQLSNYQFKKYALQELQRMKGLEKKLEGCTRNSVHAWSHPTVPFNSSRPDMYINIVRRVQNTTGARVRTTPVAGVVATQSSMSMLEKKIMDDRFAAQEQQIRDLAARTSHLESEHQKTMEVMIYMGRRMNQPQQSSTALVPLSARDQISEGLNEVNFAMDFLSHNGPSRPAIMMEA